MLVTNWGPPIVRYVVNPNFCIKGTLEHDRVNMLIFTTAIMKMFSFVLIFVCFLLVANKVGMWPYRGHFQL